MEYTQLARAIEVIAKLRDPENGCPWDLEQTHQSLTKYLVEETYEFLHATNLNDKKLMEEEIGDVLLQVLLHSQIAKDNKDFNIESVAKKLADKIIHRHPHVFDPSCGKLSKEQIVTDWEKHKQKEKKESYYIKLEDTFLPSLMAAHKIGEKSKKVNFDWDNIQDVMAKVEEEWQEVKDEFEKPKQEKDKIIEEIGDLLFSIAQLTRHLGIPSEEVLQLANQKFVKRFNKVEDEVKKMGAHLTECSQDQLEQIWQKIK